MEKQQDPPADGEWGWDVPIESDDAAQSLPDIPDVEIRNDGEHVPTAKPPMLSKISDNKINAAGVTSLSLSNGIKSSPSFQELEVRW